MDHSITSSNGSNGTNARASAVFSSNNANVSNVQAPTYLTDLNEANTWEEKVRVISKYVLGGTTKNVFFKGLASCIRMRKQRHRQALSRQGSRTAAVTAAATTSTNIANHNVKVNDGSGVIGHNGKLMNHAEHTQQQHIYSKDKIGSHMNAAANAVDGVITSSSRENHSSNEGWSSMDGPGPAASASGPVAGSSQPSAAVGSSNTSAISKQHRTSLVYKEYADHEEIREALNTRTIQKIEQEFECCMQFCSTLRSAVINVLKEIDPHGLYAIPFTPSIMASSLQKTASTNTMNQKTGIENARVSTSKSEQSSLSRSDQPFHSTLRSNRRMEPKHNHAIAKLLRDMGNDEPQQLFGSKIRFRNLIQGDFVAKKVPGKDEYVLAKVMKRWISPKVSGTSLMQMSDQERISYFGHNKVCIQEDVEGNNKRNNVSYFDRQDILPMPRSYLEASTWGTKLFMKGTRVLAMYPIGNSPTLYEATVIDNSTWCRDLDDIVVVEFDGDKRMPGDVPKRHVPARCMTVLPVKTRYHLEQRTRKRSYSPSPQEGLDSLQIPPGGSFDLGLFDNDSLEGDAFLIRHESNESTLSKRSRGV